MLLALRSADAPDPDHGENIAVAEPGSVANQEFREGPVDTLAIVTQNFVTWRAQVGVTLGDEDLTTGPFLVIPGPETLVDFGISGAQFNGAIPPRLSSGILHIVPHAVVQMKADIELDGGEFEGLLGVPLGDMFFRSHHLSDGGAPVRDHGPVSPNVPVVQRSGETDFSTNVHYVGPAIATNWYGDPWEWDDLTKLVLDILGDVTLVAGQQTNIVGQEMWIDVYAYTGGLPRELRGDLVLKPSAQVQHVGIKHTDLRMGNRHEGAPIVV